MSTEKPIKRDENGLYRLERGAGGRFGKVYLTPAEEQVLKEAEAAKMVAPARGQSASMLPVDTIGCAGARGPGPCPTGSPEILLPVVLEDEGRISLVPGKRLAQETVILLEETIRLSDNLFAFGRIDSDALNRVITYINNDAPFDDDTDECFNPSYMATHTATYLRKTYLRDRNTAPKLVIGLHTAPVFTLLQYLLGLTFPDSEMQNMATNGQLIHREEADTRELLGDVLNTYNFIQEYIGLAGVTLVGEVPEEVGGGRTIPEDFSIIEMVNGAIDLTDFLTQRVRSLNSLLEAQL